MPWSQGAKHLVIAAMGVVNNLCMRFCSEKMFHGQDNDRFKSRLYSSIF